jgi:hypothetical protein
MHRALTAILPFDASLATALCVGLTTLIGSVVVSDGIASAHVEKGASVSASVAPSSPRSQPAAEIVAESETSPQTSNNASDNNASDNDAEENIVVVQPNSPWQVDPNDSNAIDREYLIQTALPGSTMMRQGPELAMERLHPEFVHRLAAAIREARESGLPSAGIFSAYRPPAFGVGGFSDKFNSLHTYGLAVDMTGIGSPGSAEAKLWYELAAKHGIVCPYGFGNRLEWNHCQPTRIKIILPDDPLRATVTGAGPITLESMFDAGNSLLESPTSATAFLSAESPERGAAAEHVNEHTTPAENRRVPWNPGLIKMEPLAKLEKPRLLRAELPTECPRPHRGRKDACEASRETKTSKITQKVHSRQASAGVAREGHRI